MVPPEVTSAPSELNTGEPYSSADTLTWTADVVRDGNAIKWSGFNIPRAELGERVFGINATSKSSELWNSVTAPDLVAMTARSDGAILAGDLGYDQEFRVVHNGRLFWLQEHVDIECVNSESWKLKGLIRDITADRSPKEIHTTTEMDVQQILKVSDCLLWRAQVFQRHQGINPDWVLQIPPSNLYRKLFGIDPPINPIRLWDAAMVPDLEEMSVRSNEAILTGKAEYEQDYRVLIDNRILWMHEHVSIVLVSPGEWSLTGILMDVTSAHAADDARKKSDAELQQTLAAADCLIWHSVVTSNGAGGYDWDTFAARSALYTKLFGGEPDYQQSNRFKIDWKKLQVAEVEDMSVRYKRAFDNGNPGYEQEFKATVGNTTYWLREQVKIKYLENETFDLVGVITDISGKREAETALATEKERLAVTLKAMAEGVITTDVEGRIQFINPAAAYLTQFDASLAVGRPITDVCVLQHGAQVASILTKLNVQGDRIADLPPQTHLITKTGSRTVEGCCAPIHAADSTIIGMVLVFRDTTERERLEQELVKASRLESVGILAGGIAHDFNNILTAIIGYVSLAILDVPNESDTSKCLQEAHKASLRARDLTQQLLTFANGGEPVRATLNLADAVKEVAEFALHGSSVTLELDMPEDLWPVDADKGQIGRVVQNLVINAVQAMPNGGSIRIAAFNGGCGPSLPLGDYVHIAVTDTGTGITSDDLPHIFDPYFTTKQTGSGLGLAAVYSIIKKHNGLINVESELGHGTTFHIWLPAVYKSVPAAEQVRLDPITQMKGRVLLMDDEPTIRRLATMLMRRSGLEVVAVEDGRIAVEHYLAAQKEGNPFTLVIMDLTVPGGMGGKEALGYLREIDANVRVVVSSGYSTDPVLANHKEHGFCGVITKPYDVGQFNRVIGELLRAAA